MKTYLAVLSLVLGLLLSYGIAWHLDSEEPAERPSRRLLSHKDDVAGASTDASTNAPLPDLETALNNALENAPSTARDTEPDRAPSPASSPIPTSPRECSGLSSQPTIGLSRDPNQDDCDEWPSTTASPSRNDPTSERKHDPRNALKDHRKNGPHHAPQE
ncbi:hypothetical protein ACQ86G_23945 [Roseateles chitinivorans]|uniref:hypothetical protein n=1 Tax=Roseateles chitinivorans TaxID=2917965 RepID=UPI003D6682C1